jgi:hypothetical protein
MFIDRIKNQRGVVSIYLRESYRIGKKTGKRTLLNLTHYPEQIVKNIELAIKGRPVIAVDKLLDSIEIVSKPDSIEVVSKLDSTEVVLKKVKVK